MSNYLTGLSPKLRRIRDRAEADWLGIYLMLWGLLILWEIGKKLSW